MQIQPGTLQFSEYLKRLPPAWVIEHFFSSTAAERKILSSAMIDDCARQFATAESLHQRFLALAPVDRLRCAQMFLLGTTGIISTVSNGLDDPIVASFLGFAARDPDARLRIFGFEMFEPILRKLLTEALLESNTRDAEAAGLPICNWQALNDIAVVAAMAGQHQLIKKRSGRLGVAALQVLRKVLRAGDLHKVEDVEAIADAITGYCIDRQLFSEDEKEFLLCPESFARWQRLPIDERVSDVAAFTAARCGGWNINLFRNICERAAPKWISVSGMTEAETGLVRETLLALQFAGIAEVRKAGTELLFQQARPAASHDARAGGKVVIMPDFTVVAAQECDPDTLFEFASFCKINSLDRVYHGAIEKEALIEAVNAGNSRSRIESFLREWNAPVNVVASVREWIREFDRVSLSSDPVLVCAETAVADQISACEQLRPWLERIDVAAVFRIRPGGERTVRDIVRKLGFDERMPGHGMCRTDSPQGADELLAAAEPVRSWTLITDPEAAASQAGPAIRGSKYGAEMKTLELSDVVQVIDYAILTGQRLVLSYEGSPYVRRGTYTVVPIVCGKGVEPMLDAELERTGSRKQFYIKKIAAIGVVPQ